MYNSIFADAGQYGSNKDCSLLSNSNTLNILEPDVTEGMEDEILYLLLGDEIYYLNTWLMKPFLGDLSWVE